LRLIFFTVVKRKKAVPVRLLLALLLLLFSREITAVVRPVNRPGLPLSGKTIVIDPGHGGYDPGVYAHGVKEKDVVLAIALKLRDYLQGAGARVVMTRETDRDLLVLPAAGPKKRQDMKNRLIIINAALPELVVSVHANAIASPRWRGAQVFYRDGDEASKSLAVIIQGELARVLKNTDREASPGNFLILNESPCTAVLVETGFISNPEEARLLSDPGYQGKVAWSIYLALFRYLSQLP
jgi:N-acetylmuramoyl-L-alanine amidase